MYFSGTFMNTCFYIFVILLDSLFRNMPDYSIIKYCMLNLELEDKRIFKNTENKFLT